MRELSWAGLVRRGSCQHSYSGSRIQTDQCHCSFWCWERHALPQTEEQQILVGSVADVKAVGRRIVTHAQRATWSLGSGHVY